MIKTFEGLDANGVFVRVVMRDGFFYVNKRDRERAEYYFQKCCNL